MTYMRTPNAPAGFPRSPAVTPLVNASRAYRADVYVDDTLNSSVLFLDESMAQSFANGCMNDDGLAGISKVEVVAIPVNDAAVDEWYAEIERGEA